MLCVLIRSAVLIAFASHATAAPPDPDAVAFGTLPALWNLRISPDGSKVSFLRMHPEELPILTVLDLTTGKANLALASTQDGFDIQWCDWANDEWLLCGFAAVRKGVRSHGVTRLVAVNSDGSQMKVLLQQKLKGEFAQFQDRVVDWLVDDPKRVLVIVPKDDVTTLNSLDIYTGGIGSAVARKSGFVHWISDGRGSPRLYRYMDRDEIRWNFRLSGEKKLRELDEHKIDDLDHDYYPLGFGGDPNQLLVLKPHEERLALWSVDLTGGKDDEIVFSHPEVDVGGAE